MTYVPTDRRGPEGRPPNGERPQGPGRAGGPPVNGAAYPGPPNGARPRGGVAPPNGAPPLNGAPAASRRVPPPGVAPAGGPPGRPAGGPPRPPGRVNGRPVGPPPRRPDPADDEPTVVHGPLVDGEGTGRRTDAAAAEAPGRHRRRAGASPKERPAASYREQVESGGRKPRSGRRRRSTFWKELPLLVVVALLLTFLIQTFLAKVYVIPSGSMETTLHGCTGCNNDRVLVDKITYRFTDPAPGDVVVFRGPDSWSSEIQVERPSNPLVNGLQQFGSLIGLAPPDEKDFVKRVIAVGGQTVQCCDSRDRVLVDGEPLNEPYVYYLPQAGPARQATFGPVTVPEGQLWMMGDSRNNSADSRAPDHGPVPVENVIGKARMIVLPFSRLGWIEAIDPQPSAAGMGSPLGAGAPLALGLLGTVPFAFGRRRLLLRNEQLTEFLPAPRRKWSSRRR
jgi:signal peptidase I